MTRTATILLTALATLLAMLAPCAAQEAEQKPPNYEDHIKPIFTEYCVGCHRGSRARNGFKMNTFAAIMEGGSSGAAVLAGDAGGSLLYQVVAHEQEPFMPYEDDALEPDMVKTIREWIDGGARETASSAPLAAPRAAPVMNLDATRSTEMTSVMPGALRRDPFWYPSRSSAVIAMDTSPTAPLLAVAGHRQVTLYHAETLARLGVLSHEEGVIHCLRFSRNGALLIAGGGRGADSGTVVGWDVATGERVLQIGAEPDVVLSCDLSPDQRFVALGGPDGLVRVYSTSDAALIHEIDAHTDWVTAVAFSPDGILLASGDRAGNLYVWEGDTGREFHALPGQKGRITAVTWRPDGMVVGAAVDEDKAIRLYEMDRGTQARAWNAHGGVLDLRFASDGSLVSVGRDRVPRHWDGAGKQLRAWPASPEIATAIAISHDRTRVFGGDWQGVVRVLDGAGDGVLGTLRPDPPTVLQESVPLADAEQQRLASEVTRLTAALVEAEATLAQRMQEAETARAEAAAAEAVVTQARATSDQMQEALSIAETARAPLDESANAAQATLDVLTAQLAESRTAADRAQAEMLEAVQTQFSAEQAMRTGDDAARSAAEEQRALALRLLEGATAVAQRAAEHVAALDIELARRSGELAQWTELARPYRERAAQASAALQAAQAALNEATTTAQALIQHATEATSVVGGLTAQRDAAKGSLEATQASLNAAVERLAQMRQQHDEQKKAIAASGGRVP